MTTALGAFISKMEAAGMEPAVIDLFSHYYRQLASGETGLLPDREIRPLSREDILDAADLTSYAGAGLGALPKTVSIVLNGGLGTSMGLTGAKSLIPVKQGKSFLEIKLKQAERQGARLAFMNSYNTHQDTLSAVSGIHTTLKPLYFTQNKFPKVLASNLSPVQWPDNPELEWNPPGHGDVYAALSSSGTLNNLLESGIEYAFIANSDNLGATLDESLLGYFASHDHPFLMEVAERTPADLKGGHLAKLKSGRLTLREIAQCPEDEIDAFQDIRKYRYFNTNNLWINLKYLKSILDKDGAVRLPMIVNTKTVNPRRPDSPVVYQIETAMGAAISIFQGSAAVKVSENRFLPVKKCQDLLVLRSDCYVLDHQHRLLPNPERKGQPPKITLDPAYFAKLDDFDRRFQWIPSLVGCDALTVKGNVFFQKDVTVTGTVTITHPGSSSATIPKGSVIDRDISL